jgi:hypothetical protein
MDWKHHSESRTTFGFIKNQIQTWFQIIQLIYFQNLNKLKEMELFKYMKINAQHWYWAQMLCEKKPPTTNGPKKWMVCEQDTFFTYI